MRGVRPREARLRPALAPSAGDSSVGLPSSLPVPHSVRVWLSRRRGGPLPPGLGNHLPSPRSLLPSSR